MGDSWPFCTLSFLPRLMNARAIEEVNRELKPGEQILWAGRPRSGLSFEIGDVILIPGLLAWFAALMYALCVNFARRGNLLILMWASPLVLFGIYGLIGRFMFDAFRRSRIFYGLSDRRIIIIKTLFGRRVSHFHLSLLPAIQLFERSNRSGTIALGQCSILYLPNLIPPSWPGATSHMPPLIELIEDARHVYDLVLDAQRKEQGLPSLV